MAVDGRTDVRAEGGLGPLWYVSYGSNLGRERFDCYLLGGSPVGSSHTNPGCRDASPPLAVRRVEVPHDAYFHGASPTWGGGVAFLDHHRHPRAGTLGRGYLIAAGQFADVLAQEGRRPTGGPLPPALAEAIATGRPCSTGTGWYDTVVPLGLLDGHPAVTFTAAWTRADVQEAPPSAAYRSVLEAGLVEAWGLTPAEAAAYVDERLPGSAGS
ncbi:hypothetical protein KSP35_06585 [Aquihabitans sp. G128]|uniref:hypothetical protein n=1 Tax=Aquihabitans sp. G128 TaxID=2849779 RepID=UPI001C234519|nr:hypothetical protein [Aquihabitans sp. G128]QXC62462.1 hypothetical protein KSP35_06585 [Aquihabitans sp. G128]